VKQETNKLLDGAQQLSDALNCNYPGNLLISVKKNKISYVRIVSSLVIFLGTSKCVAHQSCVPPAPHTYVRVHAWYICCYVQVQQYVLSTHMDDR
jgi:hypothetical protein